MVSVNFLNKPLFLTTLLFSILNSGLALAQLEEIIVTAERTEGSMQTTPIAVTAMSADDLERMQITSALEIDIAVPGMRIDTNPASTTALNVALRGTAESNAAFAISEAKVGLYQNGVYRRLSGGNIELADIERIEVLRGPQGTLFGRNTLAGAINVVTRVPGQETYGELSASYGSFDTISVRALIGGGITDNFTGSLSVLYKDRAEGPHTNMFDGEKVGEESFEGFQANLNWDASDNLNLLFSAYSSTDENDGAFGSPVNVATEEIIFGLPNVFIAPPLGLPDQRSFARSEITGADLTLTWDINENLTLKSISHSSTTDTEWGTDFTAGGVGSGLCSGADCISGFFRISESDQSQYSQEIQLLGGSDRLEWLVGVYYYSEETDQFIQDYLSFGAAAPASYFLEATSSAVFGQLTYNLTDSLSLTLGARQTEDDKELTGNKANAFFAPQDFSSSPNVNQFSSKIGLDYVINEDMFVYGSFSQGFKSGGFDAFASADVIGIALEPELVDAYEFGFKGDLLNDYLRVNAALFESRYTDFVVTSITAGNGLASANIGEAAISGAELEATWLATDAFTLFLSMTHLFDNGWDETGGFDVTGVSPGDAVPFVSEQQWTLGATYEWELEDLGQLALNATAKFDDEYYPQATHQNRSIELVRERYMYNLGLAFTSLDESHKVWLNGRNVTDENDYYTLLNFSTFLFNNTASYLVTEPASWELGYKYSF